MCSYITQKASVTFNADFLSKMKDFSRLEAVTYTVKVVVSQKLCKVDMLLPHTTNRKYHMAYRFVPFPITSNALEGHSLVAKLFECNSANIRAARFQLTQRVARSLGDS